MERFQLELIITLPIFPPSRHVGWDDGGKISKIIINSNWKILLKNGFDPLSPK